MNPYLLLALAAALLGAGVGGFRLGVDHEKASQIDKAETVAAAVDAANVAAANAIAALKPKYTTIQGKLEKTIETNTVYRDCRADPIGMQLLNQALSGGTAAPGSGKLPDADATR